MSGFPKRPLDGKPWKRGAAPPRRGKAAGTAWEEQADWWDKRQGEKGDDFHSQLVVPAVLRQLKAEKGEKILDLCAGTGVVARALAEQDFQVTGIDASRGMVAIAEERGGANESYAVGDVRQLEAVVGDQQFDHALFVLALQDLDPIGPPLKEAAAHVKSGGRLVIVLTHPAYRQPRKGKWGWDEDKQIQYRRVDGYMLPSNFTILTHPGQEADTASTRSYHRPISAYINALGANGWAVTAAEELCSHRRGSQGRKSRAEDLAAREFPVFLVLTATRLPT